MITKLLSLALTCIIASSLTPIHPMAEPLSNQLVTLQGKLGALKGKLGMLRGKLGELKNELIHGDEKKFELITEKILALKKSSGLLDGIAFKSQLSSLTNELKALSDTDKEKFTIYLSSHPEKQALDNKFKELGKDADTINNSLVIKPLHEYLEKDIEAILNIKMESNDGTTYEESSQPTAQSIKKLTESKSPYAKKAAYTAIDDHLKKYNNKNLKNLLEAIKSIKSDNLDEFIDIMEALKDQIKIPNPSWYTVIVEKKLPDLVQSDPKKTDLIQPEQTTPVKGDLLSEIQKGVTLKKVVRESSVPSSKDWPLAITPTQKAFNDKFNTDSEFRKNIFDNYLTIESLYCPCLKITLNDKNPILTLLSAVEQASLLETIQILEKPKKTSGLKEETAQALNAKYYKQIKESAGEDFPNLTKILNQPINPKSTKAESDDEGWSDDEDEALVIDEEETIKDKLIDDNSFRRFVREQLLEHDIALEKLAQAKILVTAMQQNDYVYELIIPSIPDALWDEFITGMNSDQFNKFYDHLLKYPGWKSKFDARATEWIKKNKPKNLDTLSLKNENDLKILRLYPEELKPRLSELNEEELSELAAHPFLKDNPVIKQEQESRKAGQSFMAEARKLMRALSFAVKNSTVDTITTIVTNNQDLLNQLIKEPTLADEFIDMYNTLSADEKIKPLAQHYNQLFDDKDKRVLLAPFTLPPTVHLFKGHTPEEAFKQALLDIENASETGFKLRQKIQKILNGQQKYIKSEDPEGKLESILKEGRDAKALQDLKNKINTAVTFGTVADYKNLEDALSKGSGAAA
ncbi:hypothetical protein JST56_06235 [Candidatus Dependentiae bacterium]|jgi:hypothetical protein|nr:hypothetical protein [Candidatus Dependentiae bacterium]